MTGLQQLQVTVLPGGKVSRADAAKFVGRRPGTLRAWSAAGVGPTPIMIRGRAFYRVEDLVRFAEGTDVAIRELMPA